MSWQTFIYNFQWSDYVRYIDGWLPKFAIFFPLIGYLILFNDTATEYLQFEDIAKPSEMYSGLNSPVRLRLLYYGLLFLAASNALYRLKRPLLFKYGTDEVSFTQTALENFNYSTFARLRHNIIKNGHLTKDVDDEDGFWEEFAAEAVQELETSSNEDEGPRLNIGWEQAKQRHGSMLRSILKDTFFRASRSRRVYLTACIALSTVGYCFLALPSIDIFIRVSLASLGY